MSFSVELKKELLELNVKQACCKKSLAWGILLDADHEEGSDEISISFSDISVAEAVRKIFAGVFGKSPDVFEKNAAGNKRYVVNQSSRTAANMVASWDAGENDPGVKADCVNCSTMFLRGALIGCATVNDPQKEAHLEFRFKHATRAALLYPFLEELGYPPKIFNRKTGSGLYYKRSGIIEDLLLQCGAQQAGFAWINDKIKNEIRNTENRVTNCEARNIQKAVSASHRHIVAIRRLMSVPSVWESLPEELRYTAQIRLANENASLQELLRLHDSPISKSGLNHRLNKILDMAQSIQQISELQE